MNNKKNLKFYGQYLFLINNEPDFADGKPAI